MMNKIKIENGVIKLKEISKEISVVEVVNDLGINTIKLDINEDTDLVINYKIKKINKLNITINIKPNCHLDLLEIKEGNNHKIKYTYNLEENSSLYLFKFDDMIKTKEMAIINLNGEYANINYYHKIISRDIQDYDVIINHNYGKTNSNINLNGVNILKGVLNFNVTGIVPNGKKECNINQINRIITLNNNSCTIKPNLLIDEFDVTANHSALIGKFRDDEMFYLQSRGITEYLAINLLVKGFILKNLNKFDEYKEELEKIINKYWR